MKLVAVVLALASLAVPIHAAQEPAAPVDLAPGRPVEREIKGGETHTYRITLEASQYLGLAVEQRGIDVTVRVVGPDGAARSLEVDDVGDAPGFESVDVVADAAGAYVVEIHAADPKAAPGRYEALAKEVRPATEREAAVAKARRIVADAAKLAEPGTHDAYAAAITKVNEALPLFQALGDKRGEEAVHSRVGEWLFNSGDLKGSAAANERGLAIARELRDHRMEGEHLGNLGVLYRNLGDTDRAVEYLTRARDIWHELGNRVGEADVSMSLGVVNKVRGDNRAAIALYEQALAVYESVEAWPRVATAHGNIANSQWDLGDADEALPHYEAAVKAYEKAKDRRRMAYALASLADAYKEIGEWRRAADLFDRAVVMGREVGDARLFSRILYLAGGYYAALGESEPAETYTNEALALARKAGEKEGEANMLFRLAELESDRGQHDLAISTLLEAANGFRDQHNNLGVLRVLRLLGTEYVYVGRPGEALASCDEALRLAHESGARTNEWRCLMARAKVREKAGDAKGHAEDLTRALEVARSSKAPLDVAETLKACAADEVREGRLDEARRDVEEALAIEAHTGDQTLGRELQQTLLGKRKEDLARQYVDVLMRLDRKQPGKELAARALEAAENVRARDLLETLDLAGVDATKGVDATLRDEERRARLRLGGKQDLVVRLAGDHAKKELVDAAEREAEEARAHYRDVWLRIRAASPTYAALRRPEPPTLGMLQREALDADTTLLEYSLGEMSSYLWVVTPKGVTAYDLGPRQPIEAAVARVRELLTARACVVRHETDEARAARVARADAEYPAAAAELSRLVLAPAGKLATNRVAVVADGALQLVPFAALAEPATAQPLVAAHEMVSLPSAATLAAQRRQLAGRAPAPKALAVLADPVYDAGDARLAGVSAEKTDGGNAVIAQRGIGCGDRAGLVRLPGTREEADAIAALVPPSDRLEVLGFDANLELVSGEKLRAYRVVHFATHGFAPAGRPDLAGVVLSLYDKAGRRKDGVLGLYGLYNLDVPAELVVLSGCETAVGGGEGGEGLVGVARGFMYAGARRVVASLWKVDDAPTAELMKRFYRAMLKGKRTPAAALREAQLEMLRSKEHAAPFYWASFNLYGEWR
jgi:CHAT domain-containing protein